MSISNARITSPILRIVVDAGVGFCSCCHLLDVRAFQIQTMLMVFDFFVTSPSNRRSFLFKFLAMFFLFLCVFPLPAQTGSDGRRVPVNWYGQSLSPYNLTDGVRPAARPWPATEAQLRDAVNDGDVRRFEAALAHRGNMIR